MDYYLPLLVLSVCTLAHLTNACQFGNEGIQEVFDRFELFRKTKAFDPADSNVPLRQYQIFSDGGEKTTSMEINGVYMSETHETDGENKLQTKSGQYRVDDGVTLNYVRDENGEFSFEDWRNQKKFKSSLRSLDAELPSDFEEDYKQVLVDLKAMRNKMFDYQKGLSKEGFERIRSFEFTPYPNGDGFSAHYNENDGERLTVFKENGNDDISGRLSCDDKAQKYDIVDGKVVADGEPFVPVYH